MRKFYNLLKITYHIIGKHKDVFECYSDEKKALKMLEVFYAKIL